MKKNIKHIVLLTGIFLASYPSCTNLDEELFNQIPVDQFGKTQEQINSLVAPIYLGLRDVFPNYLSISEVASDMAVVPTRRAGDWDDLGVWKELRIHSWTPLNGNVIYCYNTIMSHISECNYIYYMISTSNATDKGRILAEIRGVRAYWYYSLIDLWGNVPIVTDFTDVSKPETKTREQVFDFIMNELNEIKDSVRSDVTSSSYGKMTRGAVYTMLAKMYLNAMVWKPSGGEKWMECAKACDTIMSLNYLIEPDWKTNFQVNNEVSREAIFSAIFSRQDPIFTGNSINFFTLHYLDGIALGLQYGGLNGICAMPAYVKEFDTTDIRYNGSFLTGPMKDPKTGEVLIEDKCSTPVIHTVDFTMKYDIGPDGWGKTEEGDGARCYKWQFESGLNSGMENDFHIFRLADVYLMKAEALVRMGTDNAEATRLVNAVRSRAFDGNPSKLYSSVTLNDIYMERRFEFAWESVNRQDQIRFGTFLDAIEGWKGVSDPKYLLFPIPQEAIDSNDKLKQNPGY
jgi:starch-binding outer membrane protein, SusD/RagB family